MTCDTALFKTEIISGFSGLNKKLHLRVLDHCWRRSLFQLDLRLRWISVYILTPHRDENCWNHTVTVNVNSGFDCYFFFLYWCAGTGPVNMSFYNINYRGDPQLMNSNEGPKKRTLYSIFSCCQGGGFCFHSSKVHTWTNSNLLQCKSRKLVQCKTLWNLYPNKICRTSMF